LSSPLPHQLQVSTILPSEFLLFCPSPWQLALAQAAITLVSLLCV
jgi:hypothetical protein